MKTKRIIAAAALIAAAVAVTVTFATASDVPRSGPITGDPGVLSGDALTLSTVESASSISLRPAAATFLERLGLGVTSERQLRRTSTGVGFHVLDTAERGRCFALSAALERFDFVACPEMSFPSPYPVVDASAAYAPPREQPRLISVQGFAVDGVETIEVVDRAGRVVTAEPLVDNTYWVDPWRLGDDAVEVRGLARDGAVVFSSRFD